jgi:hypothetical protein
MGVRQALNFCFAMIVQEMDTADRREFEEKLNGWDVEQEKANKALWDGRIQGGNED